MNDMCRETMGTLRELMATMRSIWNFNECIKYCRNIGPIKHEYLWSRESTRQGWNAMYPHKMVTKGSAP